MMTSLLLWRVTCRSGRQMVGASLLRSRTKPPMLRELGDGRDHESR